MRPTVRTSVVVLYRLQPGNDVCTFSAGFTDAELIHHTSWPRSALNTRSSILEASGLAGYRRRPMPHKELIALLRRARKLLDQYLFEPGDQAIRDDVAEVCMAIDDALPEETPVGLKKVELERSAA
jgi:hypothetical protein